MTKSTTSLPLTIALQIPTYWTSEQAFAVFQLVDDLRDAIWQWLLSPNPGPISRSAQAYPAHRDDKDIGDPPFCLVAGRALYEAGYATPDVTASGIRAMEDVVDVARRRPAHLSFLAA